MNEFVDRARSFVAVNYPQADAGFLGGSAQIAAICRTRDAVCATRNTKDFVKTGIAPIDPWTFGA